jgi:hypothetical protein
MEEATLPLFTFHTTNNYVPMWLNSKLHCDLKNKPHRFIEKKEDIENMF